LGKLGSAGCLESSSGAGDCWVSQLVEERHELILYFKMLWSRIKGMFDIWTLNHLSNRSCSLIWDKHKATTPSNNIRYNYVKTVSLLAVRNRLRQGLRVCLFRVLLLA
jgi:hypothetical protein